MIFPCSGSRVTDTLGAWVVGSSKNTRSAAFRRSKPQPKLCEDALDKKFDILLVFIFDRIGYWSDETPFVVK